MPKMPIFILRGARLTVIVVALSICNSFSSLYADDIRVPFDQPGPKAYVVCGKTPDGWGWTTAVWNGDDRPYEKIRSDIDKALAGGEQCKDLYLDYRAKAIATPSDPISQFGRAYLAWKIVHLVDSDDESTGVAEEALDGLDSVRFPVTYNMVRIRFLIQSHLCIGPRLIGVAHELYLHDRSDYDVLGSYAAVLEVCCKAKDEKNLVGPLIEQMKLSDPSRPEPYMLEGYMYTDLMTKSGTFDAESTQLALSAFQKYLQMVSPTYYVSLDVENVVKGLERIRANSYQIVTH